MQCMDFKKFAILSGDGTVQVLKKKKPEVFLAP